MSKIYCQYDECGAAENSGCSDAGKLKSHSSLSSELKQAQSTINLLLHLNLLLLHLHLLILLHSLFLPPSNNVILPPSPPTLHIAIVNGGIRIKSQTWQGL